MTNSGVMASATTCTQAVKPTAQYTMYNIHLYVKAVIFIPQKNNRNHTEAVRTIYWVIVNQADEHGQ